MRQPEVVMGKDGFTVVSFSSSNVLCSCHLTNQGMAMRLSFDLGLRLDMSESVESGKMTTDEAEARKVAFWGSFIIDQ